jgi:hypothetical protein
MNTKVILMVALFVTGFLSTSICSLKIANAQVAPMLSNTITQLPDRIVLSKNEDSVHVKSTPTFDDALMGVHGSSANRRYGTSYRNELSEKNRMRNGIPASGLGYSSDTSSMKIGSESNANRRDGTSYRHEMREKNRMRNGIPASGRKMK